VAIKKNKYVCEQAAAEQVSAGNLFKFRLMFVNLTGTSQTALNNLTLSASI